MSIKRAFLNTIFQRAGLGLLLAGACLLAGCGPKTEPATPKPGESAGAPKTAQKTMQKTGQKPGEKPKVALIMKSLANEFFKTMGDGAQAHQQKNAADYDLVVNGIKDEQDVSTQVDLVEQMIAQGVSAIVIAPADSKALVPVCKKAMAAGIVVVNIDNELDPAVKADQGVAIPFVGPDNRKGARMAGDYLAKSLKPGDKVIVIEGAPNAANGIQRKLGFEDAMKAHGVVIAASQTAHWEMEKANQVVAALAIEHPEVKAVLCANDNMALGAETALRAAGKGGAIQIVGFDNISAVQQMLKEGRILCTVDQHGDQLAVFGIEYALKMLKTHEKPADQQTPVDLVTRESLK
jgi:ribose transport system substrate-binding protein